MIPLNLKSNTGRCAPLALGNNPDLLDFEIPEGMEVSVAYSRPPLRDRACCAGDDGDALPTPYFTVEEVPTP